MAWTLTQRHISKAKTRLFQENPPVSCFLKKCIVLFVLPLSVRRKALALCGKQKPKAYFCHGQLWPQFKVVFPSKILSFQFQNLEAILKKNQYFPFFCLCMQGVEGVDGCVNVQWGQKSMPCLSQWLSPLFTLGFLSACACVCARTGVMNGGRACKALCGGQRPCLSCFSIIVASGIRCGSLGWRANAFTNWARLLVLFILFEGPLADSGAPWQDRLAKKLLDLPRFLP